MRRASPAPALLATAILIALILLPVGAGLIGTALPAFGYLPSAGLSEPGFDAWRGLFALPGLGTSLRLSLGTGLAATLLAFLLAIAWAFGRIGRADGRIDVWLAPLLATPHAAIAIGLAFLLAPSGWLVRLFSPWATGWTQPPDLITLHDPFGLSLILGLAVKETPFLILVTTTALRQLPVRQTMGAASGLGYGPAKILLGLLLPAAYARIRLPLYAVLAYAVSVVDMAVVLGPGHPPPLAVMAVRLTTSAELTTAIPTAGAASLLQGLVVLVGLAIWRLGELIVWRLVGRQLRLGERRDRTVAFLWLGQRLAGVLVSLGLAGLVVLALWSVAGAWPFPGVWPTQFSDAAWMRTAGRWIDPALTSLGLALVATLAAIALAIGCLEAADSSARGAARLGLDLSLAMTAAPLILPPITFLFGLHVLLLRADLNGQWAIVALGHLIFVFPYVYLALARPWQSLDGRYIRSAAALGLGRWQRLSRVKLPLLRQPIAIALALGFSVSMAQYLPTLIIGEGRLVSLTTEAVALSSGGDRRLTAVLSLVQAILPCLAFALASLWPAPERGRNGEVAA